MERLAQLFDDLDDLLSMLGLARERLRNLLVLFLLMLGFAPALAGAVMLALSHPPVALATAMLLFTVLFYRTVTSAHALRPEA